MSNKNDGNDKDFDPAEYMKHVSVALVNELMDIVQTQGRAHGDQFAHDLAMSIIKNTVFVLVYNALSNFTIPKGASPQEVEEFARRSYLTMKDGIQNAIADGFEMAAQRHSGQAPGYYCKISTAGPPVNTLEI